MSEDLFYVAEDRTQPGAAFASMVADDKCPEHTAKRLAEWVRRGALVKLVDRDTMAAMLKAWKRPVQGDLLAGRVRG